MRSNLHFYSFLVRLASHYQSSLSSRELIHHQLKFFVGGLAGAPAAGSASVRVRWKVTVSIGVLVEIATS